MMKALTFRFRPSFTFDRERALKIGRVVCHAAVEGTKTLTKLLGACAVIGLY